MILKLRQGVHQGELDRLETWLRERGFKIHESRGEEYTILGLVGDTSQLNEDYLLAMEIVEDVTRIQEPYKSANRKFHPQDTVITLQNGAKIGGGHFAMMAGPCSVESEAQVLEIARRVKAAGATILRGGAFKPRTSPYAFQGMGVEGLNILVKAKRETGLPIISEIMDAQSLEHYAEIDILQVGARNMQNFQLLKALGRINKPVLLKRSISSTYQEWLMSAEYVMAGGNEQVILCERGIRTFETKTRNTLDISAVPVLRELTHLPIVVDPSHAAGFSRFVPPLALAAVAVGADGLLIEVHNDPQNALCDGPQCLKPDAFATLAERVNILQRASLEAQAR